MATGLLALGLLIAAPSLAGLGSSARTAAAARHLAGIVQALRWKSVTLNRGHGLYFDRPEGEWVWWVVRDGNGNGVRSAEIRGGIDPVLSGPHRLGSIVEHVRPGFPPGGPFPEIPPGEGEIHDADDPVRFGNSNLIAFGPLGTASSGTIYVTDGHHALHAVVVYGRTVRVRTWRYDTRKGEWKL